MSAATPPAVATGVLIQRQRGDRLIPVGIASHDAHARWLITILRDRWARERALEERMRKRFTEFAASGTPAEPVSALTEAYGRWRAGVEPGERALVMAMPSRHLPDDEGPPYVCTPLPVDDPDAMLAHPEAWA